MRSVVFSLLFLALIAVGAQAGHVRFAHIFDNGPQVDVSFNGKVTFSGVTFTDVTEYQELADGSYNVTLWVDKAAQLSKIIAVQGYTTVAAEGAQTLSLAGYQDAFYRPDIAGGKSLVRFLHGIEGGPGVDLSFNGTKVASNITYSQISNYFSLVEGSLTISAHVAGTNTSVLSTTLKLEKGYVLTVFVIGTASDGSLFGTIDFDYQRANVRVYHASPDAPAVDVSVGAVTFKSLAFSAQSAYQEVSPGVQNVTISAGGATVLSFSTPSLTVFQSYTVLIYGFAKPPAGNTNSLTARVVSDPASDPNTASVRFGNFVPDSSAFLVSFNGKNFTTVYPSLNNTFSVPTTDNQQYSITVYNVTNSLGKRVWRRSLANAVTVLTTTITVSKGSLYTVLIEGSGNNIKVVADGQPAPTPSDDGSGLSSGAIAGIVIGTIFGAILLVGLIVYFYRRANYQSIP